MGEKKRCFVIGPIGDENSEIRRKADVLLHYIIKPILEQRFDYQVQRADEIAEPGLITDQIIGAIIESDLVIADLAGHNPNAFYELAIRHMEEKPVVHMALVGEPLPFDIKDYRAIAYRLETVQQHQAAQRQLADQVEAVRDAAKREERFANPITKARGQLTLERSADPKDKMIADLSSRIEEMDRALSVLKIQVSALPKADRVPRSNNALRDLLLHRAEDAELGDLLASRSASARYTLSDLLANPKRGRGLLDFEPEDGEEPPTDEEN